MSTGALDLLVFREGRRYVSGGELKQALLNALAEAGAHVCHDQLLALLLRAGELECSVADSGFPAGPFEQVTSQLAEALVSGTPVDMNSLCALLDGVPVPEQMSVSVPEGFAYYALHPLLYAEAAEHLASSTRDIVVIGIRSIGTTLSAVTAAASKKTGRSVHRITVRPEGHPYDRKTHFSGTQLALIQRCLAAEADFWVVDEGPGLSGSSFLSVAEALLGAAAPSSKITLICGHRPDFDNFCCEHGPQRAKQFCWVAVSGRMRKPDGADAYIGAGEWRRLLLGDESSWPASWSNFERLKFISANGPPEPRLFKFQGLGHYQDEILRRETIIAQAGFGPQPQAEPHGFTSYSRLFGKPMTARDLNENVSSRIAEYCAFRQRSFPHEVSNLSSLQQMAEHNLAQLNADIPVNMQLERPVLADGRMQPHEWVLLPGRQMLKTDSGGHGDDHFFPGPTDIAWDLAGAIVEWRMNQEQKEAFLSQYRRASGDDPGGRISDFIVAYSAFRAAYCLMAANALKSTEEHSRLLEAADQYRHRLLNCPTALSAIPS